MGITPSGSWEVWQLEGGCRIVFGLEELRVGVGSGHFVGQVFGISFRDSVA